MEEALGEAVKVIQPPSQIVAFGLLCIVSDGADWTTNVIDSG